jgi:hypothetical protein
MTTDAVACSGDEGEGLQRLIDAFETALLTLIGQQKIHPEDLFFALEDAMATSSLDSQEKAKLIVMMNSVLGASVGSHPACDGKRFFPG